MTSEFIIDGLWEDCLKVQAVIFLLTFVLLDVVTSMMAMNMGFVESNMLYNNIIVSLASPFWSLVLVKIIGVSVIGIVYHSVSRTDMKISTMGLFCMNMLSIYVCVRNVILMLGL